MAALGICALTLACDPAEERPDAGASEDAGSTDAGVADASSERDGGPPDAGGDDAGSAPAWAPESIAAGGLPAIAIADDGVVHVAYARLFSDGTGEIHHARQAGDGWETSLVHAGPRTGFQQSIALDGDEPRIAWADGRLFAEGTGDVFVARPSGAAWTRDTLSGRDADLGVSLAAPPAGPLGLVHGAPRALGFARVTPPDWAVEDIVADADYRAPAVAFDAAGGAHVGFGHRDEAGPGHAERAPSGTWVLETVEPEPETVVLVDLAIDPDDRPWMAYAVADEVRVAVRRSDGWEVTPVATGVDALSVAIAVGPTGTAHVAFGDDTEATVVHARDADGWRPTVVASTGSGSTADLAVDAEGRPHVVYARFDASGAATLELARGPRP